MKRPRTRTVPDLPRSEPARLDEPATPTLPGLPDKEYFRIGEAARLVGVKPYVLRYWESEFKRDIRPDRTRSNQRMYRRKDVQTFLEIKRLRYEEKLEVPGARRRLRFGAPEEALPELPDIADAPAALEDLEPLDDAMAGEQAREEGTMIEAGGADEQQDRQARDDRGAPDGPDSGRRAAEALLEGGARQRLREGIEELLRIVDEDEKAE